MPTQEIQREDWNSFFNSFSRQHEGWRATLEMLAPDLGAQNEGEDLSFEGVSLNSEVSDRESIVISLTKSATDHVTHMVEGPTRVWLQQTDEGADASLEIESDGDTKTLLRFQSPARPEIAGGIV